MLTFQEYASDPFNWLRRAKTHHRAAKLMETHIIEFWGHVQSLTKLPGPHTVKLENYPGADLLDSFWLCAAYSIESLLKGICVRNEPVKHVTATSFKLKSHNAFTLACQANMIHEMDPSDCFFLKICEEKAKWGAKYPTPLTSSDPRYHILDGPGLFERFDRVYFILETELRKGHEHKRIALETIQNYARKHKQGYQVDSTVGSPIIIA